MKHVVIGTAGHIDHGKSALVLALTGTDPDRLKEEKARGITIDLGFAHYQAGDVNFAFVDVPGHERFVKNMLAGATGIDYVILVVSADASVMPQTREHFDICRLLHVPAGVIALTKSDLVDADTIELVRMETRELVAGSFLQDAPMVAVSARTGAGLDELRGALGTMAARERGRETSGAVRLPVDRVFSVRGFGTVVTGTLVSGTVQPDDELVILPAGRAVKVRGVQVHGRPEATGQAGQRTAVNLGGVDVDDLQRGDTLAAAGTLEATTRFDAVLDLLPSAKALRHGARVRFHQGTSELLGRIAVGTTAAGKDSLDERAAPGEIAPGARARVRLRLESPAVLTRGDRFILRAYSPTITIGGGEVLDPHPARGGIRTAAGRARLAALDAVGATREDEAIEMMIGERGAAGLPISSLTARAAVQPAVLGLTIARLEATGRVTRAGQVLVLVSVLEALSARLRDTLTAYHRSQPLSEGMPREEVRGRLFRRADAGVFERVVDDLSTAGVLVARDRLSLASHRLELSDEETRACESIERAYRAAGLKPPELGAIAAEARLASPVAERMSALLVRQKVLVKVDTLLFHADALNRLKQDVLALKAAGGQAKVDVAGFKGRYGVSRKYAIPLLEYLDRERVTRRVGDSRVVL